MTTQTRIRAVRFLTLGMLFLFLFGGVLYWQAVGADLSNPRGNFWRVVREGVPAYTSTPSQGHTILIVNSGENWREIRNGFLMRFSHGFRLSCWWSSALLYLIAGRDKLEKTAVPG